MKTYIHVCLLAFFHRKNPRGVHQALKDPSWIEELQEELLQFKMQKVWVLVDLSYGKRAIDTKWVFRNKNDERGNVVRNKARLISQGHTHEEGIYYEESAFLYGTIEEDVYVCQPLAFKDPDHPNKVYKVVKALYGLHQAPRACAVSTKLDITSNFNDSPLLGVNTPRCDEDRLELMELMVFLLPKVEKVGIESDELVLLVLETIAVKKVNDVMWLQALFDKKKVVITEAKIREALRLDDAEGVECLANKEIFAELARMGYKKPSTKLIFYKAFFSSQVGKGFFRVEMPFFEGMLVAQKVGEGVADQEHDEGVSAGGDVAEGDVSAAHDEVPTAIEEPSIPSPTPPTPPPQPSQEIAQALEITKLKRRVKKLEKGNKERMIADMDADVDVILEEGKEVADDAKDVLSMQEDETEPAEVQEVVEVVATAKLIYEVTAAIEEKGVVIRDLEESSLSIIIPAKTKYKDKGKGILDEAIDHVKKKAKEDPVVKRYQVLKRKPQTEGQARKNIIVYLKNVAGFKMDYFKGISYDDIRPIFKAKFNSNVAFLQKTKEHIKKEESRALKRLNETLAEKATKSKSQEMEAVGIMWCADHYIYNHAADFVSKEEVPTHKVHSGLDVECFKVKTAELRLLMRSAFANTRLKKWIS
nr:hypothetical protein [Tanacetum cinerariifolium]